MTADVLLWGAVVYVLFGLVVLRQLLRTPRHPMRDDWPGKS